MIPIKKFQVRWNEPLGRPECPYMRRYIFLAFGWGFRIHVCKRSDDKRYFHNHPFSFGNFVLKGSYTDVSLDPASGKETRDTLKLFSVRWRKAAHLHYVDVPPSGCVTLLITTPIYQNWGFWVRGKIMRPLRFFSRYGHPPCSSQ